MGIQLRAVAGPGPPSASRVRKRWLWGHGWASRFSHPPPREPHARLFHCFRLFQIPMKQTRHYFYSYCVSLFHCSAISRKCPQAINFLVAVGRRVVEASRFEQRVPPLFNLQDFLAPSPAVPHRRCEEPSDRSIEIEAHREPKDGPRDPRP